MLDRLPKVGIQVGEGSAALPFKGPPVGRAAMDENIFHVTSVSIGKQSQKKTL
ncbi:hypothetical protein [Paraburkholderia bryophila]|uniref:hypothetical protein n=1 Tax=Paraburkholderia bryophila TaxID=420952 RepID=UPI00142DA37A|nr:hypothetical protein [Paraburkholderia bryophila]